LPELPEVETVRRGLEQKLNNFIIKKVEVCGIQLSHSHQTKKNSLKDFGTHLFINGIEEENI